MSAQATGTMSETPATLTRGVVHAGGVETKYVRAGRGDVVVLLAQGLERDDVLRSVQALSREFLVLAAVPSSGDVASLSPWLRAFLECLGVTDAHVFVHAPASLLTGDDLNA
jgi:hypothetical protein